MDKRTAYNFCYMQICIDNFWSQISTKRVKKTDEDLIWHGKLNKYIENAMSEAIYDKDNNFYVGKIPSCWGVIAFASTLDECKDKLLSVLKDWILVGLNLGHPLPVMGEIDLEFIRHIIEGIKDSKEGRTITSEELLEEIEKW